MHNDLNHTVFNQNSKSFHITMKLYNLETSEKFNYNFILSNRLELRSDLEVGK